MSMCGSLVANTCYLIMKLLCEVNIFKPTCRNIIFSISVAFIKTIFFSPRKQRRRRKKVKRMKRLSSDGEKAIAEAAC